jgi:hypothetical protein
VSRFSIPSKTNSPSSYVGVECHRRQHYRKPILRHRRFNAEHEQRTPGRCRIANQAVMACEVGIRMVWLPSWTHFRTVGESVSC